MTYRAVASTLFVVSLLPLVGCDKATPVAPSGSTLTISANPAKIETATGTSTIRVTALKPNGTPVNPGTEIRFATDLGTIDEVATTDSSGVARATLRGDGRIGTAKVSATTGGVAMAATIEVEVGTSAKTIVLQPTPTSLPDTGGRVTLLAIVRDSRGQALAGQGVNFTTDVGQLGSRGSIVTTNAAGEARDTLNVSAVDLAGNVSTINVSAQTAGSDGSLISDSSSVRIQGGRPVASFQFAAGSTANEVLFTDTSTGGTGQLIYSWDFGDGTAPNHDQNPRHTYSTGGQFTVVLTITDQNNLSDQASARITVPVTTPGTGQ
ncbi:MAG TPA: PKD domain-containing protein [Thermoanaerobaculia bacterium]|jgi:hypothetical protein|nr:PKD domain-containing protein [Thermoanaerobaculia bacterium]